MDEHTELAREVQCLDMVKVEGAYFGVVSGILKVEWAGFGIVVGKVPVEATGLGAVRHMVLVEETGCKSELDMKMEGKHPQNCRQGVGPLAAHQLHFHELIDKEMPAEV